MSFSGNELILAYIINDCYLNGIKQNDNLKGICAICKERFTMKVFLKRRSCTLPNIVLSKSKKHQNTVRENFTS